MEAQDAKAQGVPLLAPDDVRPAFGEAALDERPNASSRARASAARLRQLRDARRARRRQPPLTAIRPLTWIIAFKAFKAVVLAVLGVALLATRRTDPIDAVVRLALAIHLPLTSRLLDRALAFATTLTIARQTALALTAFAYALLMAAEGAALHFRHPWARWFTIVATSSLIPVELYEIARALHPVRVLVLAVNVAMVIYLFRRRELFER